MSSKAFKLTRGRREETRPTWGIIRIVENWLIELHLEMGDDGGEDDDDGVVEVALMVVAVAVVVAVVVDASSSSSHS